LVAMSLQMEIIVFIQEDHTSDGSSFPSTSTFLQSKSSWCPSLSSQGLRVRLSHIWPITHLVSHREGVCSQGSMGIISVYGHHWVAPFRRLATPHTGEPNFLCHDGSVIICVARQGHVLSQSQLHTNTEYRISFGEKTYHSKHPNKSPLDNEIKERLRRNTLCATISIGRDFAA